MSFLIRCYESFDLKNKIRFVLRCSCPDVPTIVFRTWELLSKAVADAAKLPSDEASDSSSEKSKKKPKESGKKTKSVSEIL